MIIPPGYAQIALIWTGSAVPRGAANVFGVENSGGLTIAQVATAAGNFAQELVPNLPDEVQVSAIRVKLGPNSNGGYQEFPVSIPGLLSSGETVAPNTAFLFKKQTAFGGRDNRGRLYLPGVLEGSINGGGDLSGSWVSDWNTAASSAMASLDSDGVPMVILHASVGAPTPVTDLIVQSRVATQRRRLRG